MVIHSTSPWPQKKPNQSDKTPYLSNRSIPDRNISSNVISSTSTYNNGTGEFNYLDGVANAKNTHFGKIQVLVRGKNASKENRLEALLLLRKAAIYVKPIMERHNWRVPILREFSPNNPALLGININGGKEIKIRLSHPGNPLSFYPLNDIIGTLLHELVHNVRAPHDDIFYAKLAELNKELDSDLANGWKGEGFDAPGQRLSTPTLKATSLNDTPNKRRELALKAAEKRRNIHLLTAEPKGGYRLGGRYTEMSSPSEMARFAAELRAKDLKRIQSLNSQYNDKQAEQSNNINKSLEDLEIEEINEIYDENDYIISDDEKSNNKSPLKKKKKQISLISEDDNNSEKNDTFIVKKENDNEIIFLD